MVIAKILPYHLHIAVLKTLLSKINAMDILASRTNLHRKLGLLRWLIPLGMVLLVIGYEIGPSRWIYYALGFNIHLLAGIILFGTVGPLLAFLLIELLARWLIEKENAELHAKLLDLAKRKELEVSQISDDTIQVLFAAGLLITNFKSEQYDPSLINNSQIEVTEQALQDAIQRLRSQIKITETV